jgi:hypothetical protein
MEVKHNTAKINRSSSILDPSISSLAYLTLEGEGHQHNKIEVKIRTSEG